MLWRSTASGWSPSEPSRQTWRSTTSSESSQRQTWLELTLTLTPHPSAPLQLIEACTVSLESMITSTVTALRAALWLMIFMSLAVTKHQEAENQVGSKTGSMATRSLQGPVVRTRLSRDRFPSRRWHITCWTKYSLPFATGHRGKHPMKQGPWKVTRQPARLSVSNWTRGLQPTRTSTAPQGCSREAAECERGRCGLMVLFMSACKHFLLLSRAYHWMCPRSLGRESMIQVHLRILPDTISTQSAY